MNRTLNVLIFRRYKNVVFSESKRSAGHSKWANIKHIKEEKDGAKAALFRTLILKMRVAVAEGGSFKPSENARLSQLVDQAKRANMPAATLNNFFEKMAASKEKSQNTRIPIRGPGGCMLIVHLLTNNISLAKINIQSKIKKAGCKFAETSALNMFEFVTYIKAEKNCSLDNATEDAISVGSDDVEEVQEDGGKYFKFRCNTETAKKIITQLQKLDYNVISIDEECIPSTVVKLSESDMKRTEILCQKLLEIEGVENIYDNIGED